MLDEESELAGARLPLVDLGDGAEDGRKVAVPLDGVAFGCNGDVLVECFGSDGVHDGVRSG